MKKILGIMGSPRINGNTHVLISKILDGAKSKGAATDIILLKDLNIKECDGCHACWKGNECSKNDDMNNIYPRIIKNDIIIYGTPVYWYGPTALMKAFLDRFVYFNSPENRAKLKGKSAVIAVPFEEDKLESADLLVGMFEKSFDYLGIPLIEKIIVPGVTKKGDVIKKEAIIKKCYKLGKKLATI